MQSQESFLMRSLSLLFLAQFSNIGTISGNFELNTCLWMIFGKYAAMGSQNKLHVWKYLFTQISGSKYRQQSNCHFLLTIKFNGKNFQHVKMLVCDFQMFPAIFSGCRILIPTIRMLWNRSAASGSLRYPSNQM